MLDKYSSTSEVNKFSSASMNSSSSLTLPSNDSSSSSRKSQLRMKSVHLFFSISYKETVSLLTESDRKILWKWKNVTNSFFRNISPRLFYHINCSQHVYFCSFLVIWTQDNFFSYIFLSTFWYLALNEQIIPWSYVYNLDVVLDVKNK